MNHLKCNYMSKKDPQVVLVKLSSLWGSQICNSLIRMISKKSETSKAVSIVIHSFVQTDKCFSSLLENESSKNNNIYINRISMSKLVQCSKIEDYTALFNDIPIKSPKILNLVVGTEILLNSLDCSQLSRKLGPEIFKKNSKYVYFFAFSDQVSDPTLLNLLQSRCQVLLDFSNKTSQNNEKLFDAFILESWGGWRKNVLKIEFPSNKNPEVSQYIPENTIYKPKDPDSFMQATFKLGLSKREKEQKANLVLPYLKIQITDNEEGGKDSKSPVEEEEESDEEIQLIDEENDVDYDYDV